MKETRSQVFYSEKHGKKIVIVRVETESGLFFEASGAFLNMLLPQPRIYKNFHTALKKLERFQNQGFTN